MSLRTYQLSLALVFAVCVFSTAVLGATSPRKRSQSDRAISAIGRRRIAYKGADWYSLEAEKKIGAQMSVEFERSTPIVHDVTAAAYIERIAHAVAQNSDTQIPVTVRIIDSEEVYALTLPAGYQYITRGLLLRISNEGQLASVLARGIAHTALRSAMNETEQQAMAKLAAIPLIYVGTLGNNTSASGLAVPLTLLKVKKDEEFDADYFGIQYLYKSGYDPECFIGLVQTLWPGSASGNSVATAFSAFPPLPERLNALQAEIRDVLPRRDGVTNTPEFATFREHLLTLVTPKSEPKTVPTLLRPDTQ